MKGSEPMILSFALLQGFLRLHKGVKVKATKLRYQRQSILNPSSSACTRIRDGEMGSDR